MCACVSGLCGFNAVWFFGGFPQIRSSRGSIYFRNVRDLGRGHYLRRVVDLWICGSVVCGSVDMYLRDNEDRRTGLEKRKKKMVGEAGRVYMTADDEEKKKKKQKDQ